MLRGRSLEVVNAFVEVDALVDEDLAPALVVDVFQETLSRAVIE
jgi:hypothetical protein